MQQSSIGPTKLIDCEVRGRGSGAELFIVEGDSAAKSVAATRNPKHQAVLPMQGKPMNAIKASRLNIEQYPLYIALLSALGFTPQADGSQLVDPLRCNYDRILLLLDPDADGIHCGALLLMYFYVRLRPLLEQEHVELVQAPLFRLSYRLPDEPNARSMLAYSVDQAMRLERELQHRTRDPITKNHYRGLASMESKVLAYACIDERTRVSNRVGCEDAEAAIAMFGGKNADAPKPWQI